MIDWDKPIQTVDGRKARVIAQLPDQNPEGDEGFFVPTMVWVASAINGFGDVILVNNSGVRCDDFAKKVRWRLAAYETEIGQPFIRNAPVKRQGWIIKPKTMDIVSRRDIFETEKDAQEECGCNEQFIRIEWEE